MQQKIAVIGGGIYGVTAAFTLAKKFAVDLFEQKNDLLQAASGINQFRLHRGYHYPRSSETAQTSLASEKSFRGEFKNAIIETSENFYAIAKKNSKTTGKQYLKFLNEHNLEFSISNLPIINKKEIELMVKVREDLIDPFKLKLVAWEKLKKAKINIFLNTLVDKTIYKKYDYVVLCTYANLNKLIHRYKQNNYQYELCEKIIVSLPKIFKNKSIVILDGPFMCIDPFGETNKFLMGNVVHAIHKTNTGKHPKISKKFISLLNNGIINDPPITNFKKFIESTEKFIPDITKAKHIGSMYTFRAVLPNKDSTDERLTTVNQVDKKTFTVFSGKIINCVDTAQNLLKKLSF